VKQGLRIDPNNVAMLEFLGLAYSGSGDHEQLLKIYEQLKGINPSSADSFFRKCVLPSSSCFR
jgi:hypothetical protein